MEVSCGQGRITSFVMAHWEKVCRQEITENDNGKA